MGDGFAGKEPVDFPEFLRIVLVAEMIAADVSRNGGFEVWAVTAIHNLQLLKVVQNTDGGPAVPAVTINLKIIAGGGDVSVRFLGFDVEFYVTVIRVEIEGVVGATLRVPMFLAFDFYFLLGGVLLRVVVHIPAEGHPELVDEIAARLLFLIGRGKIEMLVGAKIGHELPDPREGCIEGRCHQRTLAMGRGRTQQGNCDTSLRRAPKPSTGVRAHTISNPFSGPVPELKRSDSRPRRWRRET